MKLFERVPLNAPAAGVVVEGMACLRSLQPKIASTGSPYLVVGIGHRDGNATIKIWSNDLPTWAPLAEGDGLWLRLVGKAGRGAYAPEWTVEAVRKLDASHPIRDDLLPACPVPHAELTARWDMLVAQLTPAARVFLDVVLASVGTERYWRAPAAERMHHACAPYGLAWHCIEVAEYALAAARGVARYTDTLCTDVLILGGLLHDVGKILEYDVLPGIGIRRAPIADSRYHTTLGIQLLANAMGHGAAQLQEANVPVWLGDAIMAVIESHHSVKEWGSPSAPASRESWLVHIADLTSAKMESMTAQLTGATPLGVAGWYRPADPRARATQRFDLLATAQVCEPVEAEALDAGDTRTTGIPPAPLHIEPMLLGQGVQTPAVDAPDRATCDPFDPMSATALVEIILIPETE